MSRTSRACPFSSKDVVRLRYKKGFADYDIPKQVARELERRRLAHPCRWMVGPDHWHPVPGVDFATIAAFVEELQKPDGMQQAS